MKDLNPWSLSPTHPTNTTKKKKKTVAMDGTLAWCNRLRIIFGLFELIPSNQLDSFQKNIAVCKIRYIVQQHPPSDTL